MRTIRMKELVHVVGMAETQIRQAIAAGEFPRPFKLNDFGRSVGWDEAEIREWMRQRLQRHRVDLSAVVSAGLVSANAADEQNAIRAETPTNCFLIGSCYPAQYKSHHR